MKGRAQSSDFIRRRMAAIRSKNNRAELALRKALWRSGYRYRLYSANLPGRPDLVFSTAKLVVFVDGDFWHGRIIQERGAHALKLVFRAEKKRYWLEKIHRNVRRDELVNSQLQKQGWRVLRIWESEILEDLDACLARVTSALRRPTS
jgi:DNA mismatch endonuclease, patch repair protein